MRVVHYSKLLAVQVRMSVLLALQYRYDFLVEGATSLFYSLTAIIPLFVIYSDRPTVAGWSFGDALLVVGWFTVLQGVLEGIINPSLSAVVEHIRKGTLDFVLLKPADAQFLVSTAKFLPWRLTNLVSAACIFGYAFHLLGRAPAWHQVVLALALFAVAVTILYSLWILIVSTAFYVVKIDNLSYFLASVFDAARWPASVFRGLVRLLFTFVIPLAFMTTYPAEALRGSLGVTGLVLPVATALAFAAFSRLVWRRALANYTSASS